MASIRGSASGRDRGKSHVGLIGRGTWGGVMNELRSIAAATDRADAAKAAKAAANERKKKEGRPINGK